VAATDVTNKQCATVCCTNTIWHARSNVPVVVGIKYSFHAYMFVASAAEGIRLNCVFSGSDYGYAWRDAFQIKGSVCHSNSMDVVA